jgi:predicted nucleic acid-binding protein
VAVVVTDLPDIRVVRDPNDDMILACAIAAGADYLIARDNDLLSLGEYKGIKMLTPEAFLEVMRKDV